MIVPEVTEIKRWIALGALLLATFMGMIDVFIVNVAAPSIQGDLQATFGDMQMVVAGYILALAVGLTMGGRLGDTYGHRRLFVIGVTIFTIASVGCAFATSAGMLVVLRVVQGLGTAMMSPQVLSLVQLQFRGSKRGQALALYAATIGLGSITGQLLGGALIETDMLGLGWRNVFLVNVPVGILAVVLILLTTAPSGSQERRMLDLRGAAVLSAALALLLYPLINSTPGKWSMWMLAPLAGSGVAFVVFFLLEHRLTVRGGSALIPPYLFSQRGVRLGLPIALAFYSGNAGLFLILAYYFQDGLGLSAFGSGLLFSPLPAGFAIASLVGRRLAEKFGVRALLAGTLLMIASLGLAQVTVWHTTDLSFQVFLLLPTLMVSGFGQGMVSAPLMNTVLGKVRDRDAGAASATLLTTAQVANALGVAIVGAVFNFMLSGSSSFARYKAALIGTLFLLIFLAAVTTYLLTRLRQGEATDGTRHRNLLTCIDRGNRPDNAAEVRTAAGRSEVAARWCGVGRSGCGR